MNKTEKKVEINIKTANSSEFIDRSVFNRSNAHFHFNAGNYTDELGDYIAGKNAC